MNYRALDHGVTIIAFLAFAWFIYWFDRKHVAPIYAFKKRK